MSNFESKPNYELCMQCEHNPCLCMKHNTKGVTAHKRANAHKDILIDSAMKRTFETGANRDLDDGKVNYLECLSPLVIEAYGEYILNCSVMKDGTRRSCDNWKKGIPLKSFIESGFRHFKDAWKLYGGYMNENEIDLTENERQKKVVKLLCGVLFNVNGFLHEILADSRPSKRPTMVIDRDTDKITKTEVYECCNKCNKSKSVSLNCGLDWQCSFCGLWQNSLDERRESKDKSLDMIDVSTALKTIANAYGLRTEQLRDLLHRPQRKDKDKAANALDTVATAYGISVTKLHFLLLPKTEKETKQSQEENTKQKEIDAADHD